MSAESLSPVLQTTLLLCSPLRAGRNKDVLPLSLGEFNELERHLQRGGLRLEDLLGGDVSALLEKAPPAIDVKKIISLLGRGFLLALAVETWHGAGIWVVCRGEPGYPQRLQRLKQNAPPIVYGCGEPRLLADGGIAVVGSRDLDQSGQEFAENVASKAAREGMQIISGGARGVDQTAMLAALDAGGSVAGVLGDSLLRSSLSGKPREAIEDGRLTLISPFDPEAGFNVGNAMQRNKQIYALADFGVAVSSGYNEGGTWSGAIEQLDKYHLVPLFARDGADVPEGNRQLLRRGALSFPSEPAPDSLLDFLEAASKKRLRVMETADMFALNEEPKVYRHSRQESAGASSKAGKSLK
jgi:predicted Rossmann fold nucleotide-binding protein DprA/Smf involved in DNA uptake